MMSLWDALRMNMMISYQELVRTFLRVPDEVYAFSSHAANTSLLQYLLIQPVSSTLPFQNQFLTNAQLIGTNKD